MISSVQNPNIKQAVKLQNRRERDQTDLFLIEGYRELLRSLGGVQIEKLFYSPPLFLGENEEKLIDEIAAKGAEVVEVMPQVFKKLSYRDRPDGLLAVAKKWHRPLCDFIPPKNGLYVIAQGIEKPGNLGSILRSCDGAGADGVILCDRCTDLFNPNVVRASVGTLFTRPVFDATSDEVFTWLKEHNIGSVATSPDAKKVYTDQDLRQSVAIVVGTEQLGLCQKWLDQADHLVSIPMLGVADSLNVATATTLLLYEAKRQRGF